MKKLLLISVLIGLLIPSVSFGATFNYTGGQQTDTVPAGMNYAIIDVAGAGTGSGKGGRVQATIPVIAGSTLYIYVGGAPNGINGGYNGGGTSEDSQYGDGVGGGGLTDIRTSTATSTTIIVAGGAGGGSAVPGGDGGQIGTAGSGRSGCSGGGGATQSAGGIPSSGCDVENGYAGTSYQGGNGRGWNYSGGGGGGGYFGGGGGGGSQRSGGGGGSSYTTSTATGVIYTTGYQTGNGYAIITYSATAASPICHIRGIGRCH